MSVKIAVLAVLSIIIFILTYVSTAKIKRSLTLAGITAALIAVLTFLGPFIVEFINDNSLKTQDTATNIENNDSIGTESETKKEHSHLIFETKKEKLIDPKCIAEGCYDLVEYCECGEELSREKVSINALGHMFSEGICLRCGVTDPDYVKAYTNQSIMKILSDSVVSDSGTYKSYIGADSISVFATEQHNCFSINTAVSYNLWGGNVQSVIFNITDLNDIETLSFYIGGETGCSGSMTVEIYVDKPIGENSDYKYEIDASAIPTNVRIKIKGSTSLGIRVTNHSSNTNRIVFYNFSECKQSL